MHPEVVQDASGGLPEMRDGIQTADARRGGDDAEEAAGAGDLARRFWGRAGAGGFQ